MIGCRYCPQTYPDFVRTAQNQQRSGYRLLEAHIAQRHSGLRTSSVFSKAARMDDRCPTCEGSGCVYCEPDGPVSYNFNTLELLGR